MIALDLTLPSPEENLACDEALLESAEAGTGTPLLRFWEPSCYFVVLGYADRVHQDVDVPACRRQGVPILRRCSGGGTVLQGPGCLNYALILPIAPAGPCRSIAATNKFVMTRHRDVLASLLGDRVTVEGVTDLAIGARKFSGNAQRRRRGWLLFHGTFLLDFDLDRIPEFLRLPSRQPDYRGGRAHRDFLMRLELARERIKRGLVEAWQASKQPMPLPTQAIARLITERYGREDWNLGRV